jgi:lipoprotein-releasing system permease protein
MIMMIVSVATGVGLQERLEKISAFNGHIIISNFDSNQSEATLTPISTKSNVLSRFNITQLVIFRQLLIKLGLLEQRLLLRVLYLRCRWNYKWEKNNNEYLVAEHVTIFSNKLMKMF